VSILYYVYVLKKPDGVPFYVGKGQGNRLFAHEKFAMEGIGEDYNTAKAAMIKDIKSRGEHVLYEVVMTTYNEDEAFRQEAALILGFGTTALGTGPLTNIKPGRNGNSQKTDDDGGPKLKVRQYSLAIRDRQTVRMPAGAHLLSIQPLKDRAWGIDKFPQILLWALVNDKQPEEDFIIAMRENDVDVHSQYDNVSYVGTLQLNIGKVILHVFHEYQDQEAAQ